MAETDVFTRIQAILDEFTLPGASSRCFGKVSQGRTMTPGLMREKPVARWFLARSGPAPEGARNLRGETMREDVFRVEAHWPATAQEGAREEMELEVYQVACRLPEEFITKHGQSPDYGDDVSLATYDQASKVVDVEFFEDTDTKTRYIAFEIALRVLGG